MTSQPDKAGTAPPGGADNAYDAMEPSAPPPSTSAIDSGRDCGDCGLCCRLLAVDEIEKPAHVWCAHYVPRQGCGIYDRRPSACRSFRCLWLDQTALGPEWQPHRSHLVLHLATAEKQLVVTVDPRHSGAWRRAPFHDTIRRWAGRGLDEGFQVVVKIGARVIAVLPDREIDLGELSAGERIRFSRIRSDQGVGLVARKVAAGE